MKFSLPRLRRRAFTLLELLIVVVLIGILSGLAMIQFGRVQERAYVATMQSDLRNFATARALYISDADEVPSSVSQVTDHAFSEFVHELAYQSPSASEWSLVVGHNKSKQSCTLSALDLSKTHRISCGEMESVEFAALETAPNTVDFDATQSISDLAFSGDADAFALLAAAREDIELVSWNFGDGTGASGSPETHTKVSHTYATSAEYTVGLTLLKKSGEVARGTKTVGVTGNHAPIASFTFTPTSPTSNQEVTFTSTSTDPDLDALSFVWSIDGSPVGTASSLSYTFSTTGTFTVSLSAADGRGGSHSTSQDVTVAQASSGIVFSGQNASGEEHLFRSRSDGTEVVQITSGTEGYRYPAVSPDGRYVVYRQFGLNNVRRTDLTYGTHSTLLSSSTEEEFTWDPTGTRIAARSWRDGTPQVWVFNADGSNLQQLTSSASGSNFHPRWSPDGSRIAFISNRDGAQQLYVMNADGTNETRVSSSGVAENFIEWKDSNTLLFNRSRSGGGLLLLSIKADGSGETLLQDPAGGALLDFSASLNQVLVRYNDGTGNHLYVQNLDGSGLKRLTSRTEQEFEGVWR